MSHCQVVMLANRPKELCKETNLQKIGTFSIGLIYMVCSIPCFRLRKELQKNSFLKITISKETNISFLQNKK